MEAAVAMPARVPRAARLIAPEGGGLAPPLKWAGGKRWQVPEIRPLWEANRQRRFVEPFCGGLSMTLALQPKAALANDVNPHLVNFYRQLQKGLRLELSFGQPMKNDEKVFYRQRDRFNALLKTDQAETAEAASLFFYLNRTGYNGLCRFNASGGFNVPYGRYRSINYDVDLGVYRAALANVRFECQSFETLPLRPTDFVYADPPYDVQFTSYSKGGFSWDDQQRVARWLARHPGPVVLVNQATPRIVKLYAELGFDLQELSAPRRISCNGDRTAAREVIALRNL